MNVRVKRVYDEPAREDGLRVLVDRLWPRGLSKAEGKVDLWLPEVAPSAAARQAFGHQPARWEAFKARYWAELRQPQAAAAAGQLLQAAAEGPVTLLYAARDRTYNNAAALAQFLQEEAASGGGSS